MSGDPTIQVIIQSTFEGFRSWLTQYLWANKFLKQGMPVQFRNSEDRLHIQYTSPTGGLISINVQLIDADNIQLAFYPEKFFHDETGKLESIIDKSDEVKSHLENLLLAIQNRWSDTAHIHDSSNFTQVNSVPEEILSGLQKFRSEFGAAKNTAFIIMKFNQAKPYKEIVKWITRTLEEHNIIALRADHKEYLEDLFPNIKVYMHGCDFGIAIIDRVTDENINPNVSLEVGYMLGLGKNVLLLKDKNLKSLPSDLTGKLYKEFDTTDVKATLPEQINKWLHDKGYIQKTN